MSTPKTLTDRNFASVVMGAERLVVLEFWAPWCKACERMQTIMSCIADKYRDQVTWVRANECDCPSLRKRLGIIFVPTLLLFSKGVEIERVRGIVSLDEIQSLVTRRLQSSISETKVIHEIEADAKE